jgi:tetratricopeptide (TPR) repeat protein
VADEGSVDQQYMARLSVLVTELANSQDVDRLQQLLASNHELLSDGVEALLDRATVAYDTSGRTQEAQATGFVRGLISSCRLFGTDAFFDALRGAMADPTADPQLLENTVRRAASEVAAGHSQSLDELRSACARIVVLFSHSPIAVQALHMYGVSMRRAYQRSGDENALESAVYALTSALRMASSDSDAQAYVMTDLGNALKNRGLLHSSVADLDRAIELQREARRRFTAEEKAYDGSGINLGSTLLMRYRLTKSDDDVMEAIALFQQAARPEANPSTVSLAFQNLALALSDRFENSGDIADLSRAIEADVSALNTLPTQDADAAERLHTLGMHLRTRFLKTSQRQDLDEAITVLQRSLDSSDPASPKSGSYHGDLGAAYEDRFRRYGDVEDHRAAIQCFREAITVLPEGSFDLAMQLHNLGEALCLRQTKTDSGLFDEGLGYLEQAVALCAALDESSSLAWSNLASALTKRFETTGDLASIFRIYERLA